MSGSNSGISRRNTFSAVEGAETVHANKATTITAAETAAWNNERGLKEVWWSLDPIAHHSVTQNNRLDTSTTTSMTPSKQIKDGKSSAVFLYHFEGTSFSLKTQEEAKEPPQ